MGCAQSKIENEESVSRCKDRKLLMKQALAARNAFAAAHFAYAVALKNTGVALSGYAHGEAAAAAAPEIPSGPPPEAAAVPPPPPPPQEQQPLPPPPPLPSFSPSPASLQRSVTMPELPKRGVSRMGSISFPEDDAVLDEPTKNREIKENGGESTPPASPPPSMAWDYFHMNQEEDDDDEEEEDEDNLDHHRHHPNSLHHLHNHSPRDLYLDHDNQNMGMNVNPMDFEFQTPEKPSKMEVVVEEEEEEEGDMEMETPKPSHFTHSNTAPTDIRRANKMVNGSVSGRSSVNWYKVLKDIDDHFLKASECAQEVSRLLEANRYQYHYNFADTRVPVDHAARVMRVITWNRPGVAGNGKDDYYGEENETHAIVLDKLLAWEKKLYDEVKAGELMKMEYQRKVALLTKQKKRGVSAESLEKTKAAVSHLHTRYIVDMQSMDSTVSEVNDLRDRQLYPKLVELIDAMANMWESMSTHHDDQLKIVTDLRSLDIIVVYRETTRDHHDQTTEFLNVVEVWQQQFEKLVVNQKSYVRALHTWLKLNLIPIESTLKEKVSSPPRIQDPPIKSLIQSWYEFMEKLPEEVVMTSISSFVAVISTIRIHQEEEMKLKEKWEDTNKEYIKRKQAFEEWLHKHNKRASRAHHGDVDDEAGPGDDMEVVDKDPVTDRQAMVESLKNRLDEEVEDHRKHCMQVREKSMGGLKNRLPELFRAMSDYSHASADAYSRLRYLALSQNHSIDPKRAL
ncbi:hypothetical protein V2J09_004673 [Rumex salicifolius]